MADIIFDRFEFVVAEVGRFIQHLYDISDVTLICGVSSC